MRISDWSSDVCSSDLVRGPEVWNMLKAMESGPGSISTTHARSAEHTIEKLVSCAMEKGPQVTRELAISKLAAAIDIVMYLRSEVVPNGDGTFRQQRWVAEVLAVRSAERRVGKEWVRTCRSRWSPYRQRKNKKREPSKQS